MTAPTPGPAKGSEATPTTPCDVCGVAFEPGDVWNYHARLGVYVHTPCAADGPVRGEDISTHTVLWGQVPTPDPTLTPLPEHIRADREAVTPAVRRAAAERVRFDGEPPGWDDRKELAGLWQRHAPLPAPYDGLSDAMYQALIAVAAWGFHRGVEQVEATTEEPM